MLFRKQRVVLIYCKDVKQTAKGTLHYFKGFYQTARGILHFNKGSLYFNRGIYKYTKGFFKTAKGKILQTPTQRQVHLQFALIPSRLSKIAKELAFLPPTSLILAT